jgi:integrase
VAWARVPESTAPTWASLRFGVVRGFLSYLQAFDPQIVVPPAGLVPDGKHRAIPYIYSDADVLALINACTGLQPELRTATYQTLIGLLAVTGIRRSEAIGIDRADLDLAHGLVLIRHAKNGGLRRLPLHPSTVAALQDYALLRDRIIAQPRSQAFFLSTRGTRVLADNLTQVFARLVRSTGLDWTGHPRRPRLHDLRHTFAVRTLQDWHQQGLDTAALLPRLTAYLGHENPEATYWYLTGTAELLAAAAARLETTEEDLP